jgi:hypothetical protein
MKKDHRTPEQASNTKTLSAAKGVGSIVQRVHCAIKKHSTRNWVNFRQNSILKEKELANKTLDSDVVSIHSQGPMRISKCFWPAVYF